MIYLDYAANCPVNKEVLDLFYETSRDYIGNPNSSHKLGRDAKQILDKATKEIAVILQVKENEIIYTSGATESNNLAIKGVAGKYKNKGKHIITTELEHSSVLGPIQTLIDQGFEVDRVEILANGLIDLEHLQSLIRQDTILVSISYVDGELGIVQPIDEIAGILKQYPNCIFHSDATQAIGKITMDLSNIDLISIAPHKFYGLNGIGILIKKERIRLEPLIHGGKSTTMYRSGTPLAAMVASTAKALEIIYPHISSHYQYTKAINQKIREELAQYPEVCINSTEYAMPYILNFSFKGIKSTVFAEELETFEIYVSTKTACCPANTMSRPVYALTRDKKLAFSTMRISISHLTTEQEINEFISCFKVCYNKLKQAQRKTK